MDPFESAVSTLVGALADGPEGATRVAAIDGRSGVGKSTLAAALGVRLGAPVIDGDDFYAGGTAAQWDGMSAAAKADHCINWRRQRPVLQSLRQGDDASWFRYDWEAGDGRLLPEPARCPAAHLVILEGVYSARPELADLVDVRILVDVSGPEHQRRLVRRGGPDYQDAWTARWDEAERHYFDELMPASRFDLVVTT